MLADISVPILLNFEIAYPTAWFAREIAEGALSRVRNVFANWYNFANGRFRLGPGYCFGRARYDSSSAALCRCSRHPLDHHLSFPGSAGERSRNSHLSPAILLG